MRAKKNLAWHFVGDKLRDGSPVPADGVWLEYKGPLVLCKSGLHWSRQPFDALQYACGAILCLVEIGGEIVEGADKGIASRRKIITRMDASELLRYFARMQALSVLHLNEDLCNSEVLCDYLMTGDESLRDAAKDAAWDAAAWDAAWDEAAWDAAWDAALDAAKDAAWDAAWDAALDAAALDAAALDAAALDAARQHFNGLVYECFRDFL